MDEKFMSGVRSTAAEGDDREDETLGVKGGGGDSCSASSSSSSESPSTTTRRERALLFEEKGVYMFP